MLYVLTTFSVYRKSLHPRKIERRLGSRSSLGVLDSTDDLKVGSVGVRSIVLSPS